MKASSAPRLPFQPGPDQELLLKVLLLEGSAWSAVWNQWSRSTDLNTLDDASYGLLPALYKKVVKTGVSYPHLDRLKGVYRKTWYRNQLHFDRLRPVLKRFDHAGIPVLLLKGGALTLQVYRDFGLRTMADLDFLVPTHQAAQAISQLRQAGWQFTEPRFNQYPEAIRLVHSLAFKDHDGYELDLHRFALYFRMTPDLNDSFWSHARPFDGERIHCLTLSPEDQLLSVIIHGVVWHPTSIRWVMDTGCLLQQSRTMDWERFVAQCRRHELVLPVREALGYLASTFQSPVPEHVYSQLMEYRVSAENQMEYEFHVRPNDTLPLLLFKIRCLKRSLPSAGRWHGLLLLGKLLQFSWHLPSLWLVPIVGISKIFRRLVRGAKKPFAPETA